MSENLESSRSLGLALLAAVGVEARDVLSVTLTCEAGELPSLTVKRAVRSGLAEQLGVFMDRYSVRLLDSALLANQGECVDLSLQRHTTHPQAD